MLTQRNIDYYRMEILRAEKVAREAVQASERSAGLVGCLGCFYCDSIVRHKKVLGETVTSLLSIVDSFSAGETTAVSFPKKMNHSGSLYRGFILDTGEYVDLFHMNHCDYRERYISVFGEERAFRIITVHSSSMKNKIEFVDRKYPPTGEQIATLRELMIGAEGDISFRFVYETNHPNTKRSA